MLVDYYIQRGHSHKDILNLTPREKLFYLASMAKNIEYENEKLNALFRIK